MGLKDLLSNAEEWLYDHPFTCTVAGAMTLTGIMLASLYSGDIESITSGMQTTTVLAGSAGGAALGYGISRKDEYSETMFKIGRKIYQNPGKSSLAFGVATALAVNELQNQGYLTENYLHVTEQLIVPKELFFSVPATIFSYLFIDILKSTDGLLNMIRSTQAVYHTYKKNADDLEWIAKEMLRDFPLNADASRALIYSQFLLENYNNALAEIARYTKQRDQLSKGEKKQYSQILLDIRKVAAEIDYNLSQCISAYDQYLRGNDEKAFMELAGTFENRISDGQSLFNPRLFFADLIEPVQPESAQKHYTAAFEELVNQGFNETRTISKGDGRNKTLVTSSIGIPFVLKTYEKKIALAGEEQDEQDLDSLATEVLNLIYYTEVLGDESADFVRRPIQINGKRFLVLKEQGNQTLYKATTHTKRKCMKQAVDILAKIHIYGRIRETTEEELEDPSVQEDYFTSRLERILFEFTQDSYSIVVSERTRRDVLDNYGFIDAKLRAYSEKFFYKDANTKNFLVCAGGLKAIDFESTKKLMPQLDLVTLLEFTAVLTPKSKTQLINRYLRRLRRAGIKLDKKEFMEFYDYAALQRHLELIGYCERDKLIVSEYYLKQTTQDQKYHLEQAKNYANLVAKQCNEREKATVFKLCTALETIKIIEEYLAA